MILKALKIIPYMLPSLVGGLNTNKKDIQPKKAITDETITINYPTVTKGTYPFFSSLIAHRGFTGKYEWTYQNKYKFTMRYYQQWATYTQLDVDYLAKTWRNSLTDPLTYDVRPYMIQVIKIENLQNGIAKLKECGTNLESEIFCDFTAATENPKFKTYWYYTKNNEVINNYLNANQTLTADDMYTRKQNILNEVRQKQEYRTENQYQWSQAYSGGTAIQDYYIGQRNDSMQIVLYTTIDWENTEVWNFDPEQDLTFMPSSISYWSEEDTSFKIEYNDTQVVYEIIDIPGVMFTVLTMPFTFISGAFNLTLFPATPYSINISNIFLLIISLLVFVFIIKKILGMIK